MFKNYFKVALRTLWKQKFYTSLNVFGLSFGIAVSLILFQFIRYHLSFDTYHKNANEIYRVVTELHLPDGSVEYDQGTPLPLTKALATTFPGIQNESVLLKVKLATIGVPNAGRTRYFSEKNSIAFTDEHWFHLFDYHFEEGNGVSMATLNTAVITRRLAEKYFGTENPIGRTIQFDNKNLLTITGIIKDFPANTDLKTDLFISRPTFRSLYPEQEADMSRNWSSINSTTYSFLQLPANIPAQSVESVMTHLERQYFDAFQAAVYRFHLQPLKEMHFDGRYGGTIRKSLLITLACVGAFLIMIACFNFINLASAQSARRAKEIGTRKVIGGTPAAIFWQFITELSCIVVLAMLFSIVWMRLFLPVLNNWLQIKLQLNFIGDPSLLLGLLALLVFVVLASGIYPAIILSRFKPIEALRKQKTNNHTAVYRKGLVIVQNVIVQGLIICTLVISLQVRHLKTADIGFNKESVLMVSIPTPDKGKMDYLANQLRSKPMIQSLSFCYQAPSSESNMGGSVKLDNRPWEKFPARTVLGDAHFLSTFQLQLMAGNNLQSSDTVREVLVNQTLVNKLGFSDPQQAIGHQLMVGDLAEHAATITGVVKDFNVHSLYTPLEPVVISTNQAAYHYVAIRLDKTNPSSARNVIREVWETAYPENVFEYRYLDEQIDDFYHKEDLLSNLIKTTTVIAIIISCLGLLGLISFFNVQRTKEIGIRKVLGAGIMDIVLMLSKDFLILLSLSIVVTAPITLYFMHQWLQGFAYRIPVSWWIFALAAAASLLITFLTISFHSVKAASINPVKSLKME